jgi:hypothetical protein
MANQTRDFDSQELYTLEAIRNSDVIAAKHQAEAELIHYTRTRNEADHNIRALRKFIAKCDREIEVMVKTVSIKSGVIEEERPSRFPRLAVAAMGALAVAGAIAWGVASSMPEAKAATTVPQPAAIVVTQTVSAPSAVEKAEDIPNTIQPKTEAPAASDGLPSESQKRLTKEICGSAYRDLYKAKMDVLNVSRELFEKTCYYDLLAMAKHESGFDCGAVGDHGHALGCFQIHDEYHDVSDANRKDYAFSAAWTLGGLVGRGWPYQRTYAIQRHNTGNDQANTYAKAIIGTSARFEKAGL